MRRAQESGDADCDLPVTSLPDSYPCAVHRSPEMPALLREQLPLNGQIRLQVKAQCDPDGQVGMERGALLYLFYFLFS